MRSEELRRKTGGKFRRVFFKLTKGFAEKVF
jgi:hypothetical protein